MAQTWGTSLSRDYHKGDNIKANWLFRNTNRAEQEDKEVPESWGFFLEKYNKITQECVPVRPPAKDRIIRRPKWMTQQALNEIRQKEAAWKSYRQRRTHRRYRIYCRACNESTRGGKRHLPVQEITGPWSQGEPRSLLCISQKQDHNQRGRIKTKKKTET